MGTGNHLPIGIYRQLLAEHFGVSVEELGLTRQKILPAQPTGSIHDSEVFAIHDDDRSATGTRTSQSQEEWRAVRRQMNVHRVPLARAAALLYGDDVRIGETGLITQPGWMPTEPIPLADFSIRTDDDLPQPRSRARKTHRRKFDRSKPTTNVTSATASPYATSNNHGCSENRLTWRLIDVDWSRPESLSFGTGTYFEGVDASEALAHEMASVHVTADGIAPPTWRNLNLRRLIGDPFTPNRLPVTARSTLSRSARTTTA